MEEEFNLSEKRFNEITADYADIKFHFANYKEEDIKEFIKEIEGADPIEIRDSIIMDTFEEGYNFVINRLKTKAGSKLIDHKGGN